MKFKDIEVEDVSSFLTWVKQTRNVETKEKGTTPVRYKMACLKDFIAVSSKAEEVSNHPQIRDGYQVKILHVSEPF